MMELSDSDTVRVSWEAPTKSDWFIIGYRVYWKVDNEEQSHVDLSFDENFASTSVMPYQTISATVCTRTQRGASDISDGTEYVGPCSSEVKITTQALEEGEFLMLFLPSNVSSPIIYQI